MKYFLDTEFIEDGKTIDLISIGIVAEDGREFYCLNYDCDHSKASQWVKDNVLAHLPEKTRSNIASCSDNIFGKYISHKRIALEVLKFIKPAYGDAGGFIDDDHIIKRLSAVELKGEEKPEFWGEWSAYDWVVFCWLFGDMVDLPKGFPMRCNDVIQYAEEHLGIKSEDLPPSLEKDGNHHALLGAKTVQQRYLWLKQKEEVLRFLKQI